MSLPHRPPTEEEIEVLGLVSRQTEKLAVMPVFFNGQERFALVLLNKNEAGMYVKLLAVLPIPSDEISDGKGAPASHQPPVLQKNIN